MDLYKKRNYWKRFLLVIGVLIIIFSVNYIRGLAKEIALQEREKAEVIAEAYRDLNVTNDPDSLNNIFKIISENKLIPIIYTDQNHEAVYHNNLDTTKVSNPKYLEKQVKRFSKLNQVIELNFDQSENHYLYYGDSDLLRKVKLYPFFQLGLIGLFILISYIAFNASKRAEQNRVWVGMAKETAHQLGTPLSSIAAWIEILKDKWRDEEDTSILNDLDKDVQRLELVADRFSKIGSPPKLTDEALQPLVKKVVEYISKRASSKVVISLEDTTADELHVSMNLSLMDWVLENLLKNALDAIEDVGKIEVVIKEKNELAVIEITDSGKGIPKSKHHTIFEPGFSTKKRGWGIGLTLVKRIVEQYHSGRIYVKQSVPGKGTTFRIELSKNEA
ncbi:MAG: HAMP domain-containing histidine kinase [Bacteroidetes bacterium]|nr:HAMP domain-containing histidine kinase [Bacteroidota bacterium]